MLNFRPMNTADIPIIKKITEDSGIQSCDLTLCGIYLWGMYYNYEICVFEDTLFIKGLDEFGNLAFATPVGAMNRKKAVSLVREYCRKVGIQARFSFVPEAVLGAFVGGVAVLLEGWSDYIYDAEKLATLSGKKLHRKKNRFNKFVKEHPDHQLSDITTENIDAVREFYKTYLEGNTKDDFRLEAEEMIINSIFDNYTELGLLGKVIIIDGEVAAFAIGERVGNTLYVHFEKADKSIDGIYEAMNCLFVRACADGACYVDREEDMGDEGLRAAKRAYYPVKMVDKYEIVFPRE